MTFKKHLLFTAVALACASFQASAYQATLSQANPSLSENINATTDDGVKLDGASEKYTLNEKNVTTTKNTSNSVSAVWIQGSSEGKVVLNAERSTVTASTSSSSTRAEALTINYKAHAFDVTINGGEFVAQTSSLPDKDKGGKPADARAVSITTALAESKNTLTLKGSTLSASANGGQVNASAIYIERSVAGVEDTINLNDVKIASGGILSSVYGNAHTANIVASGNTRIGTETQSITIEGLAAQANAKENLNLTASGASKIHAQILAKATDSSAVSNVSVSLKDEASLTGDVMSEGGSAGTANLTVALSGAKSSWAGSLYAGPGGKTNGSVSLDEGASWTGDVSLLAGSTLGDDGLSLTVKNGSTWTGDIKAAANAAAGGKGLSVSVTDNSVWTGSIDKSVQGSTSVTVKESTWNVEGDLHLKDFVTENAVINSTNGSVTSENLDAKKLVIEVDASNADSTQIYGTAQGDATVKNTSDWSVSITPGAALLVIRDDKGLEVKGVDAEAGAYNYTLVKHEGEYVASYAAGAGAAQTTPVWYSYERAGLANAGALVSALAVAPINVAGEQIAALNDHRSALRMSSSDATGVWASYLGGREKRTTAAGAHYELDVNGVLVGAAVRLPTDGGNWLVGGAFSYAKGNLDVMQSSGDVEAWSLQAFATRAFESGLYLDASAFLGRFNVDADLLANGSTRASGGYNTNGLGLSAGAGWTLRPADGFFVEPFAKVSYLTVRAKNYTVGTGSLGQDKAYSLEAEAGAKFGAEFTAAGAAFRPYVVVSGVNEFNQNVSATVDADTVDASIDGAALRVGAGLSVDVTKNLTANAALNYMKGDSVENPVYGSVGVSYRW